MNKRKALTLLGPLALLTGASYALAQTAPDAPAAPVNPSTAPVALDKVTVTSSKRSQVVLDVPYGVSVIPDSEIRDRGVIDIKDMQSVVPTLFITQNGPGQSRIQLRGLAQGVGYGQALVGEYLDEISLDMPDAQRSFDVPLVDMQRIEVLRGPQGTLYGNGALGGVIRFITRAPRLDATEFGTEVGLTTLRDGKTGGHANAIANLPLVAGTSAVRVVVGYDDFPGWIDNKVTGEKDINGAHREYGRGKLYYKFNQSVDATLLLMHSQTRTKGSPFADTNNQIAAYIPTPTKDITDLLNLVVNADLGSVRLVSSTGYLARKLDTTADLTGVYRAGLPPALAGVVLPKATSGGGYRQDIDMKVVSEELRLESNLSGPFSWTAGTYYRATKTHTDTSDVLTDANVNFQGGFSGTAPTDVSQIALFGEASYAFTPKWSVTGGLRYFHEDAYQKGTGTPPFYAPPTTPQTVYNANASFKKTTPRVNLLWKYDPHASAYASVSQGFRSGGFNTSSPTLPNYGPEDITTYELGNKGSLAGDRFQYEVAAYWSKYRNIQAQNLAPGCTAATCRATTTNSGTASGPGFDASVSALLMPGLTLDASFGYADLTYNVTTSERNPGDPLNYVPRRTGAMSLTYRFAWMSGFPGMARLDLQHADATHFIIRNQNINAATNPANYVNVRLGVERPSWQLYVEGKNLNNFNGITNPGVSGLPDVRAQPRSFGVVLRNQF